MTYSPDNESVPHLTGMERMIIDLLIAAATKMYGLEMVKQSEGNLKRGTVVYVTLARMQEKGLVESRVEEEEPGVLGPPKRLYEPTDLGRRLRAWELQGLKLIEEFG